MQTGQCEQYSHSLHFSRWLSRRIIDRIARADHSRFVRIATQKLPSADLPIVKDITELLQISCRGRELKAVRGWVRFLPEVTGDRKPGEWAGRQLPSCRGAQIVGPLSLREVPRLGNWALLPLRVLRAALGRGKRRVRDAAHGTG